MFTFTGGYNAVWGSWLAGIQSEVSLNRSNIRLQGTSQSVGTSTSTNTNPFSNPVTSSSSQVSSSSATVSTTLENKWTISEMARLGYLVRPDLLVYGLLGWSWAGFELGGFTPFIMNGFS